MLHPISGLQNSGKTQYASILTYLDYRMGNKIFSNISLDFPHNKINTDYLIYCVFKNIELKNCSFLLDEFWINCDSRSAMNTRNKIFSYLLLQTSKNDINVYITTQKKEQLDKRIRENMSRFSLCKRVTFNRIKKEFEEIESERRDLGKEKNKYLFIRVKNFKQQEIGLGDISLEPISEVFFRPLPFFGLFDTRERIIIK